LTQPSTIDVVDVVPDTGHIVIAVVFIVVVIALVVVLVLRRRGVPH
jgi:hypothetical protein